MRNRHLISIVFLLAIVLAPAATYAQDNDQAPFIFVPAPTEPSTTTDRGYFVYAMDSGKTVQGKVLIQNPGTTPITINLAAVDAETAQTGGAAFADNTAPAEATARWIELKETHITLDAKRQQTVEFTMNVPTDAEPAQYLAGIAAYLEPEAATEEQGGSGVNVQTRYVLAVQADVGTNWEPSFKIENVSVDEQPSGVYLGLQLHNDGKMFVKPAGTMILRDAHGTTILEQPMTLGLFVSGTSTTYPIVWPGTPKPGDYSVSVELQYADDQVAMYEQTVQITLRTVQAAEAAAAASVPITAAAPAATIPVWMFATVGGLLLVIIVLLVLNLRRGRPAPPTAA